MFLEQDDLDIFVPWNNGLVQATIRALQALPQTMQWPLKDAVEALQKAKNGVVTTGMGKSGWIAQKVAATLASTGTHAVYVHPAEASHGDLGLVDGRDVLIVFSDSGETPELKDILLFAEQNGMKIIGVTRDGESSLSRRSTISLSYPLGGEAGPLGLAPSTSCLLQMVLGDAMAEELAFVKGFSVREFARLHPGGRLGDALRTVKDIMSTKVPLVSAKDSIIHALMEMTEMRMGCTGVLKADGLAGIITDGDVRRFYGAKDKEPTCAEDLMTENPKSCPPDRLVSIAAKDMVALKITQLFVVENDRPIGIVHLHDCLKGN